MKALLNYATALGPRTVVVEIGDAETARAIASAHLALDQLASLVEEMPRLSLKDHLTKHKRAQAKAALRVIEADPKVTPLKRNKRP